MLPQKDIQEAIDDAIDANNIPDQFREDASQEGWRAALECRDLERAIQYWWEKEQDYLKKNNI